MTPITQIPISSTLESLLLHHLPPTPLQLPPPRFERCAAAPTSCNLMFFMLCRIITPSFYPKCHDVMTLPLQLFDIASPLPSCIYCHFDVTLRHGSVPSTDFSQCHTFPSLFGSILNSRIVSAGAFAFP